MRNALPASGLRNRKSAIVNLDDKDGPGTHWVAYGKHGDDVEETQKLTNNDGYFDLSIPLCMILGFAEDCRKILVNVKHELILTRSRNDINAIIHTAVADNTYEEFKIELTKIEWLMPYIFLSDKRKIPLFNYIEKIRPVVMSYRSWEFYEYPLLHLLRNTFGLSKHRMNWKNYASLFLLFKRIENLGGR